MSTRPTSPSPSSPGPTSRINFTSPTHSASAAARNSIISSSAKGWSPLQINKRDLASPTKDVGPSPLSSSGPRRTSSSYKHMATNSLVSNSPFRNQGATVHRDRDVVHERKTSRNLGESPVKATGSSATPKSAIGLGISAKRSTSRSSSHGSAVGGTRRVSSDRGTKVVFNSAITGERKLSGERRSSASKENESPDVRASKRTPVKGSNGLKNLAGREYVSKSPFLSTLEDGPSPKTSIPVQKDDVFSSPSPTPRRVSPSKARGVPEVPEQTSPTPSRQSSMSSRIPAPSPLRTDFAPGSFRHSASATPTRSSMTPSRRLHGPREFSDPSESPSKTKTVTFQSVADVREFERLSVEGSANSSFEESTEEDDEEQEWLDDHRNSLDDLLHESNRDDDEDEDDVQPLRVTNPDATPEYSDLGHESTTGRFVDALMDEGLLSSQPTPAFEPHSVFSTEGTPQLSTPSLGDSLHATPMLATASMDTQSSSEGYTRDRDSAGIPYGRTHHSERSAAHHARTASKEYKARMGQPSLPPNPDSKMLLNANAAQPSLYSTPFDAHQDGPMPDPFITVQTATDVLVPQTNDREEDGVPLGRTSHLERMQAAKQLATQQSLGLGMPRSPAITKGLTKATKEEEKRHSMPPKPQQLDLPEPVPSGRGAEEVKKGDRYSLPFINLTSPFFKATPQVGETSSDSASDNDRPLTPPPSHASREVKSESPHRIPSFEFEEISLQAVESVEPRTAKVQRSPTKVQTSTAMKVTLSVDSSTSATTTTSASSTTTSSRMSASTSQESDFGLTRNDNRSTQDSTSTRVRQRISREMIRDTINQRIADGSISRRSQSIEGYEYYDLGRSPRMASPGSNSSAQSGRSQRTPLGEAKAIPMAKAHTTDSVRGRQVSGIKIDTRPRSQTQSAHEALKAAERDGLISEPKSALDKLILQSPGSESTSRSTMLSPTKSTPKRSTLPPLSASVGRDKPLPSPIGVIDEMPTTPTRPKSMVVATPRERLSDTPTGEGMAAREAAIIAKRRQKQGDNPADWSAAIEVRGGRRRRSVSTGDVGAEHENVASFRKALANPRLTLGIDEDGVSILQSFQEEADNIGAERAYKVREKPIVHASYGDRVGHNGAGDLAGAKAWRSIRRPSDMNEHAAEIKALRAREAKAGTASGTIFVKVLGIEGLSVPIPEQQTFFCITLDNGIDYIRTPYAPLVPNAKVNQEFSLVEHPNFEFSLSLDIRRDPHILKAVHEKFNPPPPAPVPASPVKNSGLKGLFASPRKPRKDAKETLRSVTPLPQPTATEAMAKFFPTPNSSTIAKTHVAFKPIAKNCEAKILEIRYPMFAMFKGDGVFNGDPSDLTSSTSSTSAARKQLAKITLQMFRLPPLPGLPLEDMPQCIEDCLRGMRHHAWHGVEYQEGVLTQHGGDCPLPRRRLFKLIGGHLIAINEVTKKEVTSIDLRHVVSMVDVNDPEKVGESPKSRMTTRPRESDEGLSVRPKSFRVEFDDGEEIMFECDTDEDKSVWMDTFSGLIGKIPSNPLWAELLSTRQKEKPRRPLSTAALGTKAALAVPGSADMTQQRSNNSATTSTSGNTRVASSGYTASAMSARSGHVHGIVSSGESAVTATSSSSVQARSMTGELEIRRSAPPAPNPPIHQHPPARSPTGQRHSAPQVRTDPAPRPASAQPPQTRPAQSVPRPASAQPPQSRSAQSAPRPASAQPGQPGRGVDGQSESAKQVQGQAPNGPGIRPDGRKVSLRPKSIPVPLKR